MVLERSNIVVDYNSLKMKDSVKQDLKSIYFNNYIAKARELNEKLKKDFISDNCLPMYFTGKKDAKTVLVMLNPGNEENEYSFKDDILNKDISFEIFYKNYLNGLTNYGLLNRQNKIDAFDLKQAAFLMSFPDSGIELPDFIQNPDKKLNAQVNVLMQKLQLELIPYCSRTFAGILDNKKQALENIEILVPYINNIFDTIIEHKRTNVIFCAKQFANLFYAYNKKGFGKIEFGTEVATKIKGLEKKVYFNTVKIFYKGNEIKAGIANSFPRRDLPNAYYKMREYGKFCQENLIKIT